MAKRTIQGTVAIITGASSGIGRELAIQLSAKGASVILNARRREKLEELCAQIQTGGGEAMTVVGDITDQSVQANLIEVASQKFGRVDILINNAGVGAIGNFAEAAPDRMRKIMEVNFFAPVETTRKCIDLLKKSKRAIVVTISSVLGHRAVPLKSEYCASKFAIHGWSDSIRSELHSSGIDVLLVSPSTTDSEFFDSVLEDKSGKNPKLGKPMPPKTVAAKTIHAIERGKSEIILSWGGKSLVWLDRICPPLANMLMRRFAK